MKGATLIVQIGDAMMMVGAARTNSNDAVIAGDNLFALEQMERMGVDERHNARDLSYQK
jgi:pyruvate-formate lyase